MQGLWLVRGKEDLKFERNLQEEALKKLIIYKT